jgi:ABC transport system ATP-binding/permease protein
VTRYAGGYQEFVVQRERGGLAAAQAAALPTQPPRAAPKPKPRGGLTYAERLELDGIVDAIDRAEKDVAEIEARLAEPELYAKRGGEVSSWQARLEAARVRVATLVARWEALEGKKST